MSTDAVVALATEDDLLVTVPVTDLRALLEVALVQMDDTDPDLADSYGLAEGEPERLAEVARTLLDAVPHVLRCKRCGGDAHLNGSGFPTHAVPSKDTDHAPRVAL